MGNNANIILIAAIGKSRELGKGPDLIWRLPADLKRFKALTLGHPVVMGRKTFESIGKPLPNRINIVVTRDTEWSFPGVVVANSLPQAFSYSHELGNSEIFVIGGGEMYTQALPFANRLELTLIDAEDRGADVFFPEFENDFKKVSEEEPKEENGVRYRWVRFEKI